MTDDPVITGFREELLAALGEGAVVEVAPSRTPGRHNVWVVGEGAPEITVALVEAGGDALRARLNSLQTFETQQEAERSGVPLASVLDQRSDWPTRTMLTEHGVQLALDLESEEPSFERPIVVSFYSFRGGVGRSTALAHTAAVLASRGRRVVVVDADLEAPGIHHSFGVAPSTERGAMPLLALLARLQAGLLPDERLDIREYLVAADGFEDLYLLCAGDATPEYLAALGELEARSWGLIERNPVRSAIELVADSELEPDVVLVDARTGFTDTNAPFLLGASDHVVIVFYPSAQSHAGTELVVKTLLRTRGRSGRALGIHFVASPLPAGPGEQVHSETVQKAKEWATAWTSPQAGDAEDPDFVAVPYVSALALTDALTTDQALLEPYQAVADWLDPEEPAAIPQDATERIRAEIEFTAGNSDVPDDDVLRLFVRTEDAARLQDENILLVEGRKGTGKTTLFRWLRDQEGAIPITAPERLRTETWWPTREVWGPLAELDPDFRITWPLLVGLRALEGRGDAACEPDGRVRQLLDVAQRGGVAGFLGALRAVSEEDHPALSATDLMIQSLSNCAAGQRLIFDGLDTTFGYSPADRVVRDRAIGALMPLLLDREASLPRVRFTVFLRTDIVRGISFANQSHLFGRRLTLGWDKEDYLKTILKQALASSSAFASLVDASVSDVDEMTQDRTLQVWYALVGVRVRGKQTAFTDRWIWSRLADGNGDHSPRHIAQLFRVLAERARQRRDEGGTPLRARDFGVALSDVVSEEALTAVKDEFATEVDQVLPVFERLEQSPFSRGEWEEAGGDPDKLVTAQTMGLVADHPRERDRLVVPELYRYALKVRRRGPA